MFPGDRKRWEAGGGRISSVTEGLRTELSRNEQELLRELIRSLRTIRYGSVVLSIHDGELVEIHKTEPMRRKALTRKDYQAARPTPPGEELIAPRPTNLLEVRNGQPQTLQENVHE
jgi:hypothetical protein